MTGRAEPSTFAQRALELLSLRRWFGLTQVPLKLPAKEEHRSEPRFKVYGFGTVSLSQDTCQLPIQLMDISLRGIQYRVQVPPKVGDQVLLRLQVPGCPPFEELACIRWVGSPHSSQDPWIPVGAALLEQSHVL